MGFEFCAASMQMRGREVVISMARAIVPKLNGLRRNEFVRAQESAYALGSHSCNPFSAE